MFHNVFRSEEGLEAAEQPSEDLRGAENRRIFKHELKTICLVWLYVLFYHFMLLLFIFIIINNFIL